MNPPLVSVLMPTFNRPQFIRRAVDAVLDQSYRNVQLIVKDGGESIRHLLPDDDRLTYVHGIDRGIAHAMNQAQALAEGDLRCWANDDDRMLPRALEHAVRVLGNRAWGYGNMRVNDENDQFLFIAYGPNPWNVIRNIAANGVPQPAAFWTRWAAEVIGPFDEEVGVCCDADYWDRLGQLWEPVRTQKVLAHYTQHPSSLSVTNDKVIQESAQRVRLKHTDWVAAHSRRAQRRARP